MRRWLPVACAMATALATCPTRADIETIALAPAYVAAGNALLRFDAAMGVPIEPHTVLGQPSFAVAVSGDGSRAYVGSSKVLGPFAVETVAVVDAATTNILARIPVGPELSAVATSVDGNTAYVASNGDFGSEVVIIDGQALRVAAHVNMPGRVFGLAATPDGAAVYATVTNRLVLITRDSAAITRSAATGPGILGAIVLNKDGSIAYVASSGVGAGTVVAVRTRDMQPIATVAVGRAPQGMALLPDGSKLYVANGSDGTVSIVDTSAMTVTSTLRAGANPLGVSATSDSAHVVVTNNGSNSITLIDARNDTVTRTVALAAAPTSYGSFVVGPLSVAAVVEFYHAKLDHYFMSADEFEVRGIDMGMAPGWARSGRSFLAAPRETPQGSPVCRLYGLPSAGLDSHFYSADPAECARVAQLFRDSWVYEIDNTFQVGMPDHATGACEPRTIPVYRLWNGRTDSNHRYTIDPELRNAMIAKGYVPEGYGPLGVAMCAF